MYNLYYFIATVAAACLVVRLWTYFYDSKGLRQYPSIVPLCGLSNIIYIGFNTRARAVGSTRSDALLASHRGRPVLRLGPNRLSFARPQAIKAIYGTGTKCTKGDQYTTIGGTPNLLSVVDKHAHSIKRKRFSRAFATAHLLDWEYKVVHNVGKFLKQVDHHIDSGQEMDFRHWSNLFTLDAIMSIALSLDSNFIQSGCTSVEVPMRGGKTKTIEAVECLRSVNRAIEPFVWSKNAYTILKALSPVVPGMRQKWISATDWSAYATNLVDQRMKREHEGRCDDDLFACLLKDSKEETLTLSKEEIVAETAHLCELHIYDEFMSEDCTANDLQVDAGSDTTSIALTHVMYCLAQHPEKLSRLQEELTKAIPADPSLVIPSYEQVRDLPYLRACIDEAMRLRPSLSPGLQRETPSEGLAVDGEWISGNVMVSVSPFVAHRDPALFPNPTSFVPERWLDEKSKEFSKYILTFSAGGRICIGKNIAYLEQTILVAAIVRRYQFSLPSPTWQMGWEEYFNTWPRSLPLRFNYLS
jgi:cytochrome P450